MRNFLPVREFDTITGNPDYKDPSSGYRYLPSSKEKGEPSPFDELTEFIREFGENDESSDALDLMKIGYKRGPGDVVTIKNYVGIIQLKSGWQIQILPKISFGSGPDDDLRKTKSIFRHMLGSLRDFRSKTLGSADLEIDRLDLYEVFIRMYIDEAKILAKRGLRSAYVGQEGNLTTIKGKLSIKDQIRKNSGHMERFCVSYDEFMVDRPENKIIKTTLLKLLTISQNFSNKREINQLLGYFELVSESSSPDADFQKCVSDRSMKDYEMLLKWSKVILKNKSFTTFVGDSKARSLLFPMNEVFEAYVADQVRRELCDLPWSVSAQDRGFYLFDQPKVFALQPDIVVTKGDGSIVIMDTKWKALHDSARDNYGISQSDVYQMYAYSKKYKTPDIVLLYPLNDEMRGHSPISFQSSDGGDIVNVRVFFVDLEHMAESMKELRSAIS